MAIECVHCKEARRPHARSVCYCTAAGDKWNHKTGLGLCRSPGSEGRTDRQTDRQAGCPLRAAPGHTLISCTVETAGV